MPKRKRETSEVIETLDAVAWDRAVHTNITVPAVAALESGKVLYFPQLPFSLSGKEQRFLTPSVADARAKNVSFDANSGALKHALGSKEDLAAIRTMMLRYHECAMALVRTLLPEYMAAIEIGRTSFRPSEIAGRRLGARKDDTRLHVDAFPSSPTGGRRILRVFTNVNPQGKGRDWRLGAPFEDVAKTFADRIPHHSPALATLLKTIGTTKSYRTAYDHMMLKLHDTMKIDDLYQREADQVDFSFPPGSTRIAYTDRVSHAAMSGQHLFEQTLYLPVSAMLDPSRAPLRILERLAGRALV